MRKTAKSGKRSVKGKNAVRAAQEPRKIGVEIAGVLLVALGLIFFIAVFFNSDAVFLFFFKKVTLGLFGILGYVIPLAMIVGGVLLIVLERKKGKGLKILFSMIGIVCLLSLIALFYSSKLPLDGDYPSYLENCFSSGWKEVIGGGLFGGLLAWPMDQLLSNIGAIILFIALLLVSAMVLFRLSLKDAGKKITGSVKEKWEKRRAEQWANEYLETEKEEEDTPPFEPEQEEKEVLLPKKPICSYEVARKTEREEKRNKKEQKKREKELEKLLAIQEQEESEEELSIIGKDLTGKFQDNGNRGEIDVSKNWNGVQEAVEVPQIQKKDAFQTIELQPEKAESERRKIEVVLPGKITDTASHEPLQEIPKVPQEQEIRKIQNSDTGYQYPPVDLLDDNKSVVSGNAGRDEVLAYSALLEETLESFHVSAKVVNAQRGPKVTRYELQPAKGVKISKIVALADDIALNLAAESVRIVAPIPGKAAVGIELPNKDSSTVSAKDLIKSSEFQSQKSVLTFGLGKDITGKNIYADLMAMPHLLVAGTTGSGKSVCLGMIIMSILYRATPEEVKFIMIDPKRGVEMGKYDGIPHLMIPVVTDPSKAAGALTWAMNEMINRYKELNKVGVQDIDRYNEIKRENGEDIMPKLVIVIDEFADLMMVSSKEVEDAVCRIAQLGRASGIHLVIATQTPRANIFTGLIKANVPSRIALTVGNSLESRIIMDENGAETLLGKGDMLFKPIGKNKPVRVQGCWISDAEIRRVVKHLSSMSDTEYDDNLEREIEKIAQENMAPKKTGDSDSGAAFGGDELVAKAIELGLEYDQISTSMLQRRLRIGYARAGRLIDELELNGFISQADGSKPRQMLITWDEYQRRLQGGNSMEEEE